jgi:hypothetical protein
MRGAAPRPARGASEAREVARQSNGSPAKARNGLPRRLWNRFRTAGEGEFDQPQRFKCESPKPQEFSTAGQNWENIGWKVKVAFTPLSAKIRPKDHIDILRPLLPERY